MASEAGENPAFTGVEEALKIPTSKLRLFGESTGRKNRRMGVALALGNTIEEARERAKDCASEVKVLVS